MTAKKTAKAKKPGLYANIQAKKERIESAVLHAINGGGQNMSRACLTGALMGAQVGLRGIPARFTDGLADGQEIIALAQKVAALPNCSSHANKELPQ
jgi:ADP-ribosylglycohydrolase